MDAVLCGGKAEGGRQRAEGAIYGQYNHETGEEDRIMAEWVLEDSPEKNTHTAYESAQIALEAAERAERAA